MQYLLSGLGLPWDLPQLDQSGRYSTPDLFWMSEALTLSPRVSSATARKKLISDTWPSPIRWLATNFQQSTMASDMDMLTLSTALHMAKEYLAINTGIPNLEWIFDCVLSGCASVQYQLTDYIKRAGVDKFTHGTESVSTSLFFLFPVLLSVNLSLSLLPFFFLSIRFLLYFFPSLNPALFPISPLSHCSHLSLSLAVDYFWAAWLISVGSQAQCQGKWNAYKEAERQTETSKSLSSFFGCSVQITQMCPLRVFGL